MPAQRMPRRCVLLNLFNSNLLRLVAAVSLEVCRSSGKQQTKKLILSSKNPLLSGRKPTQWVNWDLYSVLITGAAVLQEAS